MNYQKEMDWQKTRHILQFDLTSHCNAKCGNCVRNVKGGDNLPGLPLHHFDVSLWKRIAKVDTKSMHITELRFNGNWGDVLMHPHIIEMIDYWLQYHPETRFHISTNGSMRTEKFFVEIANVLNKSNRHVIDFAVDGLEDTHSIYRRNTNFNKLIKNIKAFTQANGNARMVTTVFQHNVHQLEEIKQLAKDIGCSSARHRHAMSDIAELHDAPTIHAVKNWKDRHYYFVKEKFTEPPRKRGIVNKITDTDYKTKCPWYNTKEIQIDPWGRVWPCCVISENQGFLYEDNSPDIPYVFKHIESQVDLNKKLLLQTLSSKWFSGLEDKIWNAEYKACRKTCGVK